VVVGGVLWVGVFVVDDVSALNSVMSACAPGFSTPRLEPEFRRREPVIL
jgi:hypothetical protein